MQKQEKLREILIKYNSPEFGDSIIDEICELFGYPTTVMKCPKCNESDLKISEVEGYKYTCLICDEDLYNIEVNNK